MSKDIEVARRDNMNITVLREGLLQNYVENK